MFINAKYFPFSRLTYYLSFIIIIVSSSSSSDRLCGLVVRVLGYRSGGPGSIPGTTKKKYWVWNGAHSAS
jgi:hypothetical protein